VTFSPVDLSAREKACTELETSFVLEAGAGTGKTTLLIDRIGHLVRTGAASLGEIAAVTFTENAATTMKLRLREMLERTRVDAAYPQPERQRASEALEMLERAQISTIHALCMAILQERPLECGVPPAFRVADEAQTDLLFAEAWEEWLADRLVAGDEALIAALDNEIPIESRSPFGERGSLRGLARTLLDQRDLTPLLAPSCVDEKAWADALQAKALEAKALVSGVKEMDMLATRLGWLVAFAEEGRFLSGVQLRKHLLRLAPIRKDIGLKTKWPSAVALDEARGIAEWTMKASSAIQAASGSALHTQLVTALLGVVAVYERKKAEVGALDFLDLLLKAREALRDKASVRHYFRNRFRFLLIDEFQDTDPLQVEIARLLSEDVPGGLVVVGDPKQSIYRFRRAEVSLFRRASEDARRRPGSDVLHLTQNFRSRPAILRFVNRAFQKLIEPSEESGQPDYEPISPPPGLPEEPSVIALRFEAPFAEKDDLLRAEAAALASLTAQVDSGHYEVRDPASGSPRKSRAGDIMILARRLSQIRHLEEALESRGLRFVVEGGKSFFDRQEVHEVLSVLRAIEDPTDRVSLVAALRSSFLGVSDRDIVLYSLSGGGLWIGTVDPARPGGAQLAPAMSILNELHEKRTRVSVPALLESLYDETRILAALTGTRRGEAQIANLEKVIALAREAWALGILTLRGFANLLQDRSANAREEPDLPATRPGDPNTVRILTIHRAKGLEAPIVALYDTDDDFRGRPETVPLWEDGKIAIAFVKACQPPDWEKLRTREETRIWAEGRRLLYVACTRARDFLVIPKPSSQARGGSFLRDLVAQLPQRSDEDVWVVDAEPLPAQTAGVERADLRELAEADGGDAEGLRWDATRKTRVLEAAHRPLQPVPVLGVAARSAPRGASIAAIPRGRDFGKLVHRILQWIDLSHPEQVLSLALALAPSFAVDEKGARRAAEQVSAALTVPVLDRARRAGRIWRELPLWFPEGEELVEGVVDLAFEEEGGWVIVDYKTDSVSTDQVLEQAAHHAPQLQLYGRGLALATGQSVRERLILFTALDRVVAV